MSMRSWLCWLHDPESSPYTVAKLKSKGDFGLWTSRASKVLPYFSFLASLLPTDVEKCRGFIVIDLRALRGNDGHEKAKVLWPKKQASCKQSQCGFRCTSPLSWASVAPAKIMLQQGQPVRSPAERTSSYQLQSPRPLFITTQLLGDLAEVATLAELEAALCLAEQQSAPHSA